MFKRFLPFYLGIVLFSAGCNDEEIGSSKDVNQETIYFDYALTGEEGGELTCKLQYRFAGPNGTSLWLAGPSKVELDNKILSGDSSRYSGAYYEITQPVEQFRGEHTITFTSANEKRYTEKFTFVPVSLKTELPPVIKRQGFTLELADAPSGEAPFRLLLTDTSLTETWFNEVVTAKDGKIEITGAMLGKLKPGPMGLELYLEEERPLKQTTREGGRFTITYGLKREAVLE